MSTTPFEIQVVPALNQEQRRQVDQLIERAAERDGVVPLNEHARLEVARMEPADGFAHQLAHEGDRLVGYGFLDSSTSDPALQLVVDPDQRRRGIATAMVGELGFDPRGEEGSGRLRQGQRLQMWSFGDLPAARSLAAQLGMDKVRELLVMARESTDIPLVSLPEGVSVRSFTPEDIPALLRVNSRAFAHHPEQGQMSEADVRDRMREPWFDADGLLIATRRTGAVEGAATDQADQADQTREEVIGFHWTKVHDPETGEVYVIAVDPDRAGGGIGRALLSLGLEHLADAGVRRIILYVEGDQRYVVDLYLSSGFEVANRDVLYASASPTPETADAGEEQR